MDINLTSLLSRAGTDGGDIPTATLQSIWGTLTEREQVVLQALAELVKPETAARLGEFLSSKLNYNRVKDKSSVDTRYSTEHNLALALRDSGRIDEALPYFLGGRKLEDVIDPDELDEKRGGAYYGNIGRCLQLMGQVDPAINCHKKSAILIEKDASQEHVINQGYVRKWIGELLLLRGERCFARYFLRAATNKWEQVSPIRAQDVIEVISENGLDQVPDCRELDPRDLERFCVAWIYDRDSDWVH